MSWQKITEIVTPRILKVTAAGLLVK